MGFQKSENAKMLVFYKRYVLQQLMKLALFDLDNTLLEGDSDYGWGEYMAKAGLVDEESHRAKNLDFYEDYKAGKLVMEDYLAFQLNPLTKHPREKLLRLRAEFVEKIIRPMMRPLGISAIQKHRALGHTIIVITATNEFVTRPIVDSFNIEHLIGTQVEEIDGQWTGRSIGTPSIGNGKITRLEAWLARYNTSLADCESWFYSDSNNDLPLLSRVCHPIVVTPDGLLKSHAQAHKWRIEDWKL